MTRAAAPVVTAKGAIIVNCASTKSIEAGDGAILCNIIDETGEGIVAAPGEVRVGVTNEAGISSLLNSRMDIDGGKAWKIQLEMNDKSFETVHKDNKNANIGEISRKRSEKYDSVAATF